MEEMQRLLLRVLFLLLLLSVLQPAKAPGQSLQNLPQIADPAASPTAGPQSSSARAAYYSLPPDKLARAVAFSRKRTMLGFAQTAWGTLTLVLLLSFGVVARLRDWTVGATRRRWLQGFLFIPLLLLAVDALSLPLDLYGQHLELGYGQSVQSWAGWWQDWAKGEFLGMVVASLLALLLLWLIRKSPRRWWTWAWLASLPIMVLLVFIAPVAIEPLFNTFEPLSKSDPALVARLEQVVHRGGIAIPPDRMFLMKASEKVTGVNAYVTGFGASKRVVVWDTTIARATPDEISFIFAHEMGHYVLGHIVRGLLFAAALSLVLLWMGYHSVRWLIGRFGARWRIAAVEDWGSLAVLALAFSVFGFLGEPIANGFSRAQEHAADVYGQEAIHGIVAHPSQTAQESFQLLGESYLEDPNPRPFVEIWTYNHPSVASRAAFAANYHPWARGQQPRYFKK